MAPLNCIGTWAIPAERACEDGGIGRRTRFRVWRPQKRGGSTPPPRTTHSLPKDINPTKIAPNPSKAGGGVERTFATCGQSQSDCAQGSSAGSAAEQMPCPEGCGHEPAPVGVDDKQ